MDNSYSMSYKERLSLFLYRHAQNTSSCVSIICRICNFLGRKCCLVLNSKDCATILINMKKKDDENVRTIADMNVSIEPSPSGTNDSLESTFEKDEETVLLEVNKNKSCSSNSDPDELFIDSSRDWRQRNFSTNDEKEERVRIRKEPLFNHINKIKNGGVDDFNLLDYMITEMQYKDSENIRCWVNAIIEHKKKLLDICSGEDKIRGLVEHYKVLFNILQDVAINFELRYKYDEDFIHHNTVKIIEHFQMADPSYDVPKEAALGVNKQDVKKLMLEVNKIKQEYAGYPDSIFRDIPMTESALDNYCLPGMSMDANQFFHTLQKIVQSNMYREYS